MRQIKMKVSMHKTTRSLLHGVVTEQADCCRGGWAREHHLVGWVWRIFLDRAKDMPKVCRQDCISSIEGTASAVLNWVEMEAWEPQHQHSLGTFETQIPRSNTTPDIFGAEPNTVSFKQTLQVVLTKKVLEPLQPSIALRVQGIAWLGSKPSYNA